MPYDSVSDLLDSVKKNLPKRAKEIYLAAYNSAWEQCAKPKDAAAMIRVRRPLIRLHGLR